MEAVTQEFGIEISLPRADPFDDEEKRSYSVSNLKTAPGVEENYLLVNLKVIEPLDNGKEDRDSIDRNNQWWSFLCTFGRIPRDEMGLIHIHQE